METAQQPKFQFWGIALLLVLTYFNHTLLRDTKDALIVTSGGAQMIPYLKTLSFPFGLILGSILALLSWNGKVKRTFIAFFGVNTIFLALLAFLFSAPENKIPATAYYLWAEASILLLPLLIMGYANQVYTFRAAAIQYPLLGLTASIGLMIGGPVVASLSQSYSTLLSILSLVSFLTLMIFLWLDRQNHGEKEKGFKFSWMYVIAFSVLVMSVKFAAFFPQIMFKSELKNIFPNINDYVLYMGSFSNKIGLLNITIVLVSVIIGFLLYYKGSRMLAKVLGVITLGMLAGGASLFFLLPFTRQTLSGPASGYLTFITLMFAFKIFKELVYFGIDLKHRFTIKFFIDFLVVSFASSLTGIVASITIINFGSIKEASKLYGPLFIISMIVGLISLHWINKKLKNNLPETGN